MAKVIVEITSLGTPSPFVSLSLWWNIVPEYQDLNALPAPAANSSVLNNPPLGTTELFNRAVVDRVKADVFTTTGIVVTDDDVYFQPFRTVV
jgi:hypothetical protein